MHHLFPPHINSLPIAKTLFLGRTLNKQWLVATVPLFILQFEYGLYSSRARKEPAQHNTTKDHIDDMHPTNKTRQLWVNNAVYMNSSPVAADSKTN